MSIGKPAAVYLETSILRKLPFEIASPEFLKLKELCEYLGIPILTTKLCVDEFAERHRKNALEAMFGIFSYVDTLSGYTSSPPKVTLPKELAAISEEVKGKIVEAIRAQDVQVLDNVAVDQGRLLEMAVEKIKPFIEKGEKGFKDTIILFTIISHEKQRGGTGHSMILTDDKIYAGALDQLPEAQGVNLVVSSSIKDAIKKLEADMNKERLEFYQRRSDTLLDFLKQNHDEIEHFIREKAFFPFYSLTGPELTRSEIIKSIESINLIGIQEAVPGIRLEGMKEDRVEINFSAKVMLTLWVEPSPFPSLFGLRLRSDDASQEVNPPIFLKEERGPFHRTVDRELFVRASAFLSVEEGRDKYSDLVLENVSSVSGLASLLLKGMEE